MSGIKRISGAWPYVSNLPQSYHTKPHWALTKVYVTYVNLSKYLLFLMFDVIFKYLTLTSSS